MKPMIIFVALLLFMATFTVTASAQICGETAANTPTRRFVINANATVTDLATGLVWKRCSEGQTWYENWNGAGCTGDITVFSWKGALQAGSDAVFAGANDWRLPNSKELFSLVERKCFDPAINLTVFPATPSWEFWSSSPAAKWVNFRTGDVSHSDSYLSRAVRLVRGGQ
jgi:hypothetical protein